MDHRSRAQRRSEVAQRLLASTGELSTSSLVRAGKMASTSLRGGIATIAGAMRRTPASPRSIEKIVASLGELKGVPMKLGQLLSYADPARPFETQAALSALQTHSQPMPFARVAKLVRDELGTSAGALIDALDPQPIACASIGQVHRARLPDGTDVAVKVQHPGITKAIESDFGKAALAGRMASLLYPGLQLDRFVREARARILDECDYRAEARSQTLLAERFAGHPVLAIPAVHAQYSSTRVLVTSFVAGQHLDDFLASDPGQPERDRVGEALFDFYVGALIRWGVLSGDPHPGNYVICGDGRVAIVDHGCTRLLDAAGDRLARVTLALEAENRVSLEEAIAVLGGEALLMLRIRYGLAAVLERMGISATWRELILRHGMQPVSAREVAALRGASSGSPAASPPPPPVALAFDVVLVDGGERIIEVVREVRDYAGLGIREAKELVDSVPQILKRTRDRGEAEALKHRFEGSGAVVEIRAEPHVDGG